MPWSALRTTFGVVGVLGGRRSRVGEADQVQPADVDGTAVARERLRRLATVQLETQWTARSDGGSRTRVGASSSDRPPAAASLAERSAPSEVVGSSGTVDPVVRVLGCPAVFGGDGKRVSGFREVAVELLVYLAVHRSGASAEAIGRDVYAGVDRRRAGERLSTDLANLRDRLRHATASGRAVNPVVRSADSYRLNAELVRVDWWLVQDACRDARKPERDSPQQLEALATASTWLTEPLADGAGYEWLSGPQEHSRRLGVAVHRRLAELLAANDAVGAAEAWDRAAGFDPFDEDLAAAAIRAHHVLGDREAAGARYENLRAALAELGERPSPATVALAAELGLKVES